MLADQWHAGLGAKIHIGLVHNHQGGRPIPQKLLNPVARQGPAGGGIWIWKDDRAHIGRNEAEVDLKCVGDVEGGVRDAIEPAVARIKTVGDVWKNKRPVVMQQPLKDEGKHLVRAIAGKDVVDWCAMQSTRSLPKAQ